MGLRSVGTRLRRVIALVAVVLLLFGQYARESGAKRREEDLKRRLALVQRGLNNRMAREAMFGHLGLAILARPDRCERLSVDPKGTATPDGRAVPEAAARRIADQLLDPLHHGLAKRGDDTEHRSGLRFTRGADSVDILYELGPNHLDVWARVRAAGVAEPPLYGPRRWGDDELEQLLRDLGP